MFNEKFLIFFFWLNYGLLLWLWSVTKFRFSVQFWTEISVETERCNDTKTETEMHTETEISAETENKSFRSLRFINNYPTTQPLRSSSEFCSMDQRNHWQWLAHYDWICCSTIWQTGFKVQVQDFDLRIKDTISND